MCTVPRWAGGTDFGGFGVVATDIRADSTLNRRYLFALSRSDATLVRHYFNIPVINFQVPVVYM